MFSQEVLAGIHVESKIPQSERPDGRCADEGGLRVPYADD